MNTRLNEAEIRMMVEELKTRETNITDENVIKRICGGLESQGFQWNEDLERKIKYCVYINPKRHALDAWSDHKASGDFMLNHFFKMATQLPPSPLPKPIREA